MLYLRTGLPGASKTLNTLKEICTDSVNSGRSIYYNNIKLLFLDYDVCNSFSGWFYGVHLVNASDNEKSKYSKIIMNVHSDNRFVTLSDLPFLEHLYNAWLTHGGPFTLWLYWVRRVYPSARLSLLNSYLDINPDTTFDDVKDLNLHWTSFDDPTLWFELPHGSVIVLDECQQYFPNRRVGSPVPVHCAKFETHRHQGFDVHLITQDAKLFDVHVRRLTNKHIHYFNPFASKRVTRYESDKVADFTDYHARKNAQSSVINRDKNFYGLYWSADIHTHKFKFPKKLFWFIPIFLLFVYAFFMAFRFFSSDSDLVVVDNPAVVPVLAFPDSSTVIPVEMFDSVSHPLVGVCESLSFGGRVIYRDSFSFYDSVYIQCNNGEISYSPSDSENAGSWVDMSNSFFLTPSYLDSLGYNYYIDSSNLYLAYGSFLFIFSDFVI